MRLINSNMRRHNINNRIKTETLESETWTNISVNGIGIFRYFNSSLIWMEMKIYISVEEYNLNSLADVVCHVFFETKGVEKTKYRKMVR